jgi:DNA-binding XRE family transcriptional regulator
MHGLSQKVMARDLGIDPTTLAMWERGEAKPSKKLKERITTLLHSGLSGYKTGQ